MSAQKPISFLCLASEFKGTAFLEEAKRLGCQILLLTKEAAGDQPWPHESIDGFFKMPDLYTQPDITYAVSYLARSHSINQIIALDDYDVATAAALREHMRLPGMGESIARHFRDKLAMRVCAQDAGIRVPAFSGIFNYDDLRAFFGRVPPPWILKPRFEAGAVGIRKMLNEEDVWRALDTLGDQQSNYLLEQFLPGDVFHVDSIIWDGKPAFALVSQYGSPPLTITQGGGIFNTRTLDRKSTTSQALQALNGALLPAFGHRHGVAHTEFIRSEADGDFYFLETAARVGGANIDKMVKAATGIELWAEAAKVEYAALTGDPYQLPSHRQDYAALIICLAREESPDTSAYVDQEIVWRLDKPFHVGLLLSAGDARKIETLLDDYNQRFARDFLHHLSAEKDVRTTI